MAATSYELLVGPLLIGVVVNAFVFGVCLMQLVIYLMAGFKDSWKLIFLMSWVFVIDTFQVASSVSMLWHYVVKNFTNPSALASGPWEYASLPIFSSLAAVPIQHFMAWRIMRFSRKKWLFAYISVLSLAQAALACASAAKGLVMTAIEEHVMIIPIANAWLAVSVACDTSISALLLYYLHRSRTGYEKTDSIISRISRTTVEAAVPVAVLCILDLAFLTTTPNNNLHYMFALPVGRLFTNTFLSTLNDRKNLRSLLDNATPSRQGMSLGAIASISRFPGTRPAQVHINIEQDVHMQMEEGLDSAKVSPCTQIGSLSGSDTENELGIERARHQDVKFEGVGAGY